jgi:hypothetical protein
MFLGGTMEEGTSHDYMQQVRGIARRAGINRYMPGVRKVDDMF